MNAAPAGFAFAPYRLSGTVYGVLLNHAPALAALGDAVNAAPYKAPPKTPVLYLKPRNTLSGPGASIELPTGVPALQIGANLGAVIQRTACRVSAAQALDFVAGYAIVNDLSVPHDSFFRPSVRFKALDGSCVIGTSHGAPTARAGQHIAIEVEGLGRLENTLAAAAAGAAHDHPMEPHA